MGEMTEARPIIVIDLQEGRYWYECPMCDEVRRIDHAVGWYCGPVKEMPGEPVAEWGGEVACGMSVCRGCHDSFYGIESGRAALAERGEG